MKYKGNFFSLPNEIFLLGLSPGELAVYCYLRRCENQKTHKCWPSYKTIGDAVGMCENTVSKYIQKLIERELIAVEPTKVTTKAGVTRNRTLQFTVLPPQDAIAQHYERRLEELELETERQRLQKILGSKSRTTRVPRCEGLCARLGSRAEALPNQGFQGEIGPLSRALRRTKEKAG